MNSSQLGDGFLEGGSGGCDFLRGGLQIQGKAHGLVSRITGFHGGDDVGGIGESARQVEPLLAQTPAWSSRSSKASDSVPWKVMLVVLARR